MTDPSDHKLTLELTEHQARQFLKWLYAQPDYPRAEPPKRKALIVYTIADELEAQLGHFHGA